MIYHIVENFNNISSKYINYNANNTTIRFKDFAIKQYLLNLLSTFITDINITECKQVIDNYDLIKETKNLLTTKYMTNFYSYKYNPNLLADIDLSDINMQKNIKDFFTYDDNYLLQLPFLTTPKFNYDDLITLFLYEIPLKNYITKRLNYTILNNINTDIIEQFKIYYQDRISQYRFNNELYKNIYVKNTIEIIKNIYFTPAQILNIITDIIYAYYIVSILDANYTIFINSNDVYYSIYQSIYNLFIKSNQEEILSYMLSREKIKDKEKQIYYLYSKFNKLFNAPLIPTIEISSENIEIDNNALDNLNNLINRINPNNYKASILNYLIKTLYIKQITENYYLILKDKLYSNINYKMLYLYIIESIDNVVNDFINEINVDILTLDDFDFDYIPSAEDYKILLLTNTTFDKYFKQFLMYKLFYL